GRGMVLAERDDVVPVTAKRIMKGTQGFAVLGLSSAQDALEPLLQRWTIGSVEHVTEFLLDLVGPSQGHVVGEQAPDLLLLLLGAALPRTQDQPACPSTDAAHLG